MEISIDPGCGCGCGTALFMSAILSAVLIIGKSFDKIDISWELAFAPLIFALFALLVFAIIGLIALAVIVSREV